MKQLFTLCLILATTFAIAQQKQLNYAEKHNQVNDYIKVESYLLKAYKKEQSQTTALLIARNYIKMHNDSAACHWYKRGTAYGSILSSDKLQYALSLTKIEKYELAIIWLKKYLEDNPSHDIAQNYLHQLIDIERLFQDSAQFRINTSILNTLDNEYGAYAVEDGFYYIQARTNSVLSKNFKETHDAYDDIHFYDFDTKEPKRIKGKSNSPYHEGPMCILPNHGMMYFTRNKYKERVKTKEKNKEIVFDIYSCSIDKNGKWGKPTKVEFDQRFKTVGHPFVTADNKRMFFAAETNSQDNPDLYTAENIDGKWTNTKPLNHKCNTSGSEAFPYFLESRNMLFFSSDGLGGLGGLDIFVAYLDSDFEVTKVKNIGSPMNSSSDDFSINFSEHFSGYFSTNRKGNDDIYSFTYTPKNFEFNGIVVDKITKAPIPNAQVSVQSKGSESSFVLTDDNGEFTTFLDSNQTYTIHYQKQYYQSDIDTINFKVIDKSCSLYKELSPSIHQLSISVLDKQTQLPYSKDDALVTITNLSTNKTDTIAINKLGAVSLELEQETDYIVLAQREGNFNRSQQITTKGSESSSQSITFELEKIVLGKPIVLKEIYYDFNSANLRSSSKKELDYLASLLADNPNIQIELGSHTDNRGSDEYNLNLSESRSQSTLNYLLSLGIDKNRIIAMSYGERSPINNCSSNNYCTEDDHQINRRTEFKVIKIGQ